MRGPAKIKAWLRVYSSIVIEGLIHSSEADFFAGHPEKASTQANKKHPPLMNRGPSES